MARMSKLAPYTVAEARCAAEALTIVDAYREGAETREDLANATAEALDMLERRAAMPPRILELLREVYAAPEPIATDLA